MADTQASSSTRQTRSGGRRKPASEASKRKYAGKFTATGVLKSHLNAIKRWNERHKPQDRDKVHYICGVAGCPVSWAQPSEKPRHWAAQHRTNLEVPHDDNLRPRPHFEVLHRDWVRDDNLDASRRATNAVEWYQIFRANGH